MLPIFWLKFWMFQFFFFIFSFQWHLFSNSSSFCSFYPSLSINPPITFSIRNRLFLSNLILSSPIVSNYICWTLLPFIKIWITALFLSRPQPTRSFIPKNLEFNHSFFYFAFWSLFSIFISKHIPYCWIKIWYIIISYKYLF